MKDTNWTEEEFGLWDGLCAACDIGARIDDMGLCQVCASKLERDFIRERSWDYSASAFGLPPSALEGLRDEVIREHGPALELIAPSGSSEAPPQRKRRHRDRR